MYFKKTAKVSLILLLTGLMVVAPSFFPVIPENARSLNKQVKTSQPIIQDGLVVNYSFDGIYNTGFTYSYDSTNIYNVTWWVEGTGVSTWNESITNRLIEDSIGPTHFDDGSHTPVWIFTNASISDVILISCFGLGDYPYLVSQEFIYNLEGFGAIELWQLENLIFPGFSAWYEKSTGILIKGVFPLGPGNYTLEITDVNVNLGYVPPISGLFDGLYTTHEFTLSGSPPIDTNFTYHEYTPNVFNVTWTGGLSIWTVEQSTRIMSRDMGAITFGSGTHDPGWIHTNVSLNEIVPIAADGIGDFSFNITGETLVNLAGFGIIEVWMLDHSGSNSTAWYEKSTGLLIKGTFIFGVGSNYTFELIDTNAQFSYYSPEGGIPGYDSFLIVMLLSVVSVVVVMSKREKLN